MVQLGLITQLAPASANHAYYVGIMLDTFAHLLATYACIIDSGQLSYPNDIRTYVAS